MTPPVQKRDSATAAIAGGDAHDAKRSCLAGDGEREPETGQPQAADRPANWPTDIGGPVFFRPKDEDWLDVIPERGSVDNYVKARYQYATTSNDPKKLAPKAIVYAANDHDITSLIKWAGKNGVAIANRSGGHHYMGSSSTMGDNVQLDLSGDLFHKLGDVEYPYRTQEYDPQTNLYRIGAGVDMTAMNDFLMKNKMTLPHGECMDVHMGGHCQTGGYSPFGRTHGLMVDYIKEIDIITADGEKRKIARDTKDEEEQDIFFSAIGGSPGNIGVITHVTVEPFSDDDYPKSRGFKAAYKYDLGLYQDLLQICAEWSEDNELSKYYSLSLCAISGHNGEGGSPAGTEDTNRNPIYNVGDGAPFGAILVWASYSGREIDKYDPSIFKKVKDAVKKHDHFHIQDALAWLERTFVKPDGALTNFWGYDDEEETPLSQIVQSWKWKYPREFNLPFIKRNYMCPKGKELSTNDWVEWTAKWCDRVMKTTGLYVGAQFIPYSNPDGGFQKGNDKKTSESWRDSSMFAAYDIFYNESENSNARENAQEFQQEADEMIFGKGKDSFFGQERQLIWAPFGKATPNLDDPVDRAKFFQKSETYDRILNTKRNVDEHGVFSPNEFGVGHSERGRVLNED